MSTTDVNSYSFGTNRPDLKIFISFKVLKFVFWRTFSIYPPLLRGVAVRCVSSGLLLLANNSLCPVFATLQFKC